MRTVWEVQVWDYEYEGHTLFDDEAFDEAHEFAEEEATRKGYEASIGENLWVGRNGLGKINNSRCVILTTCPVQEATP